MIDDEFYLKIVRHSKFNPRLIEWLSTYRRVRDVAPQNFRSFVEDLLQDPSEIWIHAYEKQISEAGRSFLLALYSLQDLPHLDTLSLAFAELHRYRANKYGYSTRPEDLRRAVGELSGSFIRPMDTTNGTRIEVINPSILDMLNTIVRRFPANGLDIIIGAVHFGQLGRMWSFASAPDNERVRRTLIDGVDLLAGAVARLLNSPRKLREGYYSYIDVSLEKRLATLMEIVNATNSEELRRLVVPFAETLMAEWRLNRIDDFEGALAIIEESRRTNWASNDAGTELQKRLIISWLDDARLGCRSDELKRLTDLASDLEFSALLSDHSLLREAYKNSAGCFEEEAHDCGSTEEFDRMIHRLQAIALALGVDTSARIAAVRLAAERFQEQMDDYSDQMQDQWRENEEDKRSDELMVRDMFGSLKLDGG